MLENAVQAEIVQWDYQTKPWADKLATTCNILAKECENDNKIKLYNFSLVKLAFMFYAHAKLWLSVNYSFIKGCPVYSTLSMSQTQVPPILAIFDFEGAH